LVLKIKSAGVGYFKNHSDHKHGGSYCGNIVGGAGFKKNRTLPLAYTVNQQFENFSLNKSNDYWNGRIIFFKFDAINKNKCLCRITIDNNYKKYRSVSFYSSS